MVAQDGGYRRGYLAVVALLTAPMRLATHSLVTIPLEMFSHATRVLLPVKGNSLMGYQGRWSAYWSGQNDLSQLHDQFPQDLNYEPGDTLITRAHVKQSSLYINYAPSLSGFLNKYLSSDFTSFATNVDDTLRSLSVALADHINSATLTGKVVVYMDGLYRLVLRFANLPSSFIHYVLGDIFQGFAVGFSPTLNFALMRAARGRMR